ncbi:MAG: response regulator transcription factor [Lachnospiraceae bacterium]|nr:response regulator transcription factor [Lachnospiraceae bacterium]
MEESRILIVEDDESVALGLTDILKGSGYGTEWLDNPRKVLETLKTRRLDLILLDVNLGEENGYELCKKIREISDIPVLFLTAYQSEMDVVRGFTVGGDDYITKPFRLQELLVRVQALLRRGKRLGGLRISSGELVYDMGKHQVYKNQELLNLTPIELQLTQSLLLGWPYTLSRDKMFSDVWDKDASYVDENTLSVNISRLRDKLGTFQGDPYIETVRGIGYRWAIHVHK